MTYYTSDLHLGHENILKQRTMFTDIEEMNSFLIEKWNKKINNNDEVYILGDFSYRSKTPVHKYLEKLKGKKHLIVGNHDADWLKKISVEDKSKYFLSIEHMKVLKTNKIKITLCHYPMLSYPQARRGYMIYGHIHNNTGDDYWPLIMRRPRMLNAGVDVNGFEPVTFEELVANNVKFRRCHAETAHSNPLAMFCAEA